MLGHPCPTFFAPQMSRECFARYLKLTRRSLSDAAAIAAAGAAWITSAGEPLRPLDECLAEAAAEEGSGAAAGAEGSIATGGLGLGGWHALPYRHATKPACCLHCLLALCRFACACPACSLPGLH